jgi:hypothetical protein
MLTVFVLCAPLLGLWGAVRVWLDVQDAPDDEDAPEDFHGGAAAGSRG